MIPFLLLSVGYMATIPTCIQLHAKLVIYALNFLKANIDEAVIEDLDEKGKLELEVHINREIKQIEFDYQP